MNVIQGQKPCARYRPLFDSYISNELLIETTHDVLRHIEECSECTYELEQRLRARDLVRRSVSRVHASDELRSRIQTSLRHTERVTAMPKRTNTTLLLRVAAGLAIAVLGAALFQVMVRNPAQLAALLNIGWEQHVHCALGGKYPETPHPREQVLKTLGPEYASLLPAAEQLLPEYRIRDAHICTTKGRKFAHVILQKDSMLVSVSLSKKRAGEDFPQSLLRAANRNLHTGVRDRGEVVAFETPTHLVYIMGNQTLLEMQVVARRMEPSIRALP